MPRLAGLTVTIHALRTHDMGDIVVLAMVFAMVLYAFWDELFTQ